jgi:hypothetical protein
VLRNGECVGAIGAIRAQAMQLKDRLSKETGAPVRWVNAILAVPFAWIDVKGEPKNVAVLQQQDLLKYIQRQARQFDQAQIDRCVVALERIIRARPVPRPTTVASAPAA